MPEIALNDIELYYEEFGDGQEVLVLLHGFLSSSKMWGADYVPDLMKRYRVYTIDVRGHGRSHNVRNGCNLQQMADDICRFMDVKEIGGYDSRGDQGCDEK